VLFLTTTTKPRTTSGTAITTSTYITMEFTHKDIYASTLTTVVTVKEGEFYYKFSVVYDEDSMYLLDFDGSNNTNITDAQMERLEDAVEKYVLEKLPNNAQPFIEV
jgi:hypothetical protein